MEEEFHKLEGGIGRKKALTGRSAFRYDENQYQSFLCGDTPSNGNVSLSLDLVMRVAEQIGAVLKTKPRYHGLVVRSMVLADQRDHSSCPVGTHKNEEGTPISCGRYSLIGYSRSCIILHTRCLPRRVLITFCLLWDAIET
jgi:hypothetical protein